MKRSIVAIVLCVAAWTGATVPSQARPARDTVSVALDWTPNTNHTGIYVAQKLGYYEAAGIDVKLLPYASTAPETLVGHRKADFGFSYSAGVAFARGGRRGRHLGVRRAPAHRARDRSARRPQRHHDAEGPRRQDLRGVRHARREAAAGDRDPRCRRQGRVQERHAQHLRLRRRLPRKGRLHPPARDLGGHPGAARGQAAEDVQAGALRRPAGVLRADRLEQRVPEGRSRARAPLPGRHRAWLPVRHRLTRAPRPTS